jgi:hypothetical protein
MHLLQCSNKLGNDVCQTIICDQLIRNKFLFDPSLTHQSIEKKVPSIHNPLPGGHNLHTRSTKMVHPIKEILIEL